MKKNLNKTELYQILTAMFVGCLLISNILASKTFEVFSIILPCAVIIFPLVYIINDVLAEVYGFVLAKKAIILGFIMNIIAVAAYQIAILLPSPVFNTDISEAFSTTLGSTPRILIASMSAYLIGSLLNAKVMQIMHNKLYDKLMLRCIGSTVVGEGLDAIIFITIAFIGTMPFTSLLTMIVCQATFKILYEIIIYPITRKVIIECRKLS